MHNVATAITSVSTLAVKCQDTETLKWMVFHARRIRRELKDRQLFLIEKLSFNERLIDGDDDLDSNLGEIRGNLLLVQDLLRTSKECVGFIERKLVRLQGASAPIGYTLPDHFRQALQPFLTPLPRAA